MYTLTIRTRHADGRVHQDGYTDRDPAWLVLLAARECAAYKREAPVTGWRVVSVSLHEDPATPDQSQPHV